MKRTVLIAIMCLFLSNLYAQDRRNFDCTIENPEYKVFLKINLYEKDIVIREHEEIFGEVDGYMGSKQSSQIWIVTNSSIIDDSTAELTLINIYGSEDLIIKLSLNDEGTYEMKTIEGSTLKFAVNNKWQKIPKTLSFTLTHKD